MIYKLCVEAIAVGIIIGCIALLYTIFVGWDR